jgi:hypothetical protein
VVVQYIEPTTENGFTNYETTLERQLYRAMNHLKRLPIPAWSRMSSKSFTDIYGSSRVYPYIPAYFFRSNESPVRPPIGNNPAQSKRLLRDLFLEYFDELGSDRLPVRGILAGQRLENVAE